ncbi:capsule biosynthesis protein [Phyllobacterium sp. 0TCS1.6C]|uniref:capsule biosynthesis protein n=1 Tax=unclassified Phyllobacterium TaxID=2638441 RepID=UPI002265439A|nr:MULTISPECIES: capsule biosynthesis protein [unclassified Phyllobacterium]MCX8280289.1 capsule biosynthesis protein [Phyllobacterium sp. 0TCS1.6C]MCX8294150.1 capsule biosynthesis protein [Phyllobacterium sp. 0TCS1.6A]
MFLFVVLPTLVVAFYYALIASPIYVSESAFVVRTAAPPSSTTLGSVLQNSGITRSQDDTFSVQEYMRSRDALGQTESQLPLRSFYGPDQADIIARFPAPWQSGLFEELYQYYSRRVQVVHNDTTGITILRTSAFRPEDAFALNRKLLELGSDRLVKMNERARGDAVRFATIEVEAAEKRMIEAQRNITLFRNKELMIDPGLNSVSMVELMSRISAELAVSRASLAETRTTAPDSSSIPFMMSRIDALEKQLTAERGKVAGSDDSIAPRIADYEALILQREFSSKALLAALDSLKTARADARRQQLYLEVVVPSHLPDKAELPQGLKNTFVVFIVAAVGYLLVWLLATAIRDHES